MVTIKRKNVIVKATIEYMVDVPKNWDKQMIEFQRNGSGWCSNNIISELKIIAEKVGCLCQFINFEYVREANEEDKEKYNGEAI